VDELPAKNTVLVILTASLLPEKAAQEYVDLFPQLGIKHVDALDIQSRVQANHVETLLLVNSSSAPLSGGPQATAAAGEFTKPVYDSKFTKRT